MNKTTIILQTQSMYTANIIVGCCLATKTLNLTTLTRSGVENGCGSELLGVTSKQSYIFLWAPSGECNYYKCICHKAGNETCICSRFLPTLSHLTCLHPSLLPPHLTHLPPDVQPLTGPTPEKDE